MRRNILDKGTNNGYNISGGTYTEKVCVTKSEEANYAEAFYSHFFTFPHV